MPEEIQIHTKPFFIDCEMLAPPIIPLIPHYLGDCVALVGEGTDRDIWTWEHSDKRPINMRKTAECRPKSFLPLSPIIRPAGFYQIFFRPRITNLPTEIISLYGHGDGIVNRQPLSEPELAEGPIYGFNHGQCSFASAGLASLTIWGTQSGKRECSQPMPTNQQPIAFSPDITKIATAETGLDKVHTLWVWQTHGLNANPQEVHLGRNVPKQNITFVDNGTIATWHYPLLQAIDFMRGGQAWAFPGATQKSKITNVAIHPTDGYHLLAFTRFYPHGIRNSWSGRTELTVFNTRTGRTTVAVQTGHDENLPLDLIGWVPCSYKLVAQVTLQGQDRYVRPIRIFDFSREAED